jgi:cobalt-precorrin-5B (C1)-methyltransferase
MEQRSRMIRLNDGYTTGSCAAGAAKAAALLLENAQSSTVVEIPMPDGTRLALPLLFVRHTERGAEAAIRKDGGDDPDVTTGLAVVVEVQFIDEAAIEFRAGDGVGKVTLAGLSLPVGEPAINPGPRKMIAAALREASSRACRVTVSIPGGRDIAAKTFNPRLGIVGGLSVLGTTGRVRAFSLEAVRASLLCGLDVAVANGITAPVFVPGNIGAKAARTYLKVTPLQVVDVGNEWGVMLDHAREKGIATLMAMGHPGKLAKLWLGDWDTHSSRSRSAVEPVRELAMQVAVTKLAVFPTVEGVLMALTGPERAKVAAALCSRVRRAIEERLLTPCIVSAALVNMAGEWLGSSGDLSEWQ